MVNDCTASFLLSFFPFKYTVLEKPYQHHQDNVPNALQEDRQPIQDDPGQDFPQGEIHDEQKDDHITDHQQPEIGTDTKLIHGQNDGFNVARCHDGATGGEIDHLEEREKRGYKKECKGMQRNAKEWKGRCVRYGSQVPGSSLKQ